MKHRVLSALYSCLGVLISTFCAFVLAKLFTGTQWTIEAPLLYAAALVILASHFGAVITPVSALIAVAVFAELLYHPLFTLSVQSETDRSTLAWMVLISVSLSYLLYPTRNRGSHEKDRTDVANEGGGVAGDHTNIAHDRKRFRAGKDGGNSSSRSRVEVDE